MTSRARLLNVATVVWYLQRGLLLTASWQCFPEQGLQYSATDSALVICFANRFAEPHSSKDLLFEGKCLERRFLASGAYESSNQVMCTAQLMA